VALALHCALIRRRPSSRGKFGMLSLMPRLVISRLQGLACWARNPRFPLFRWLTTTVATRQRFLWRVHEVMAMSTTFFSKLENVTSGFNTCRLIMLLHPRFSSEKMYRIYPFRRIYVVLYKERQTRLISDDYKKVKRCCSSCKEPHHRYQRNGLHLFNKFFKWLLPFRRIRPSLDLRWCR